MSADYTDADVQAGAKAAHDIREDIYDVEEWDEFDGDRELYECRARAVLDAVVPGIVARAKAEAWYQGANAAVHVVIRDSRATLDAVIPFPENPYRADEIERP